MNTNKILSWVLVLFILVAAVKASHTLDQNDIERWYSMDSNASSIVIDSAGFFNGTITTGAETISGHLNGALRLNEADNQLIDVGFTTFLSDMCFSFWITNVKRNDGSSLFGGEDTPSRNENNPFHCLKGSGQLQCVGGGVGPDWSTGTTGINLNGVADEWQHIVISKNSSAISMWQNGSLIYSAAPANYQVDSKLGDDEFSIGGGPQFPAGIDIDEFAMINTSCSQEDVDVLWNSGTGATWDDLSPINEIVTILSPTDNDYLTDNPILFNVSWTGFTPSECDVHINISPFFGAECNNITVSGFVNITNSTNTTVVTLNISEVMNYYEFEEGSGVSANDSVMGNNASISGAAYNNSKGANETGTYSLYFTSDSVTIPYQDYYSVGTANDFSICAWIRTDDTDANYHMIFDSRDAASDGIFLAIASDNTIQASVDNVNFASGTTITDNVWHHVCASVDRDSSGATDIYIDTVAQGVGVTTNGVSVDTTSDPTIGVRRFSAGTYWDGDLDNILFINKSITQAEVTRIYNFGIFNTVNITNTTITTINATLNGTSVIVPCTFPANTRNQDAKAWAHCQNLVDDPVHGGNGSGVNSANVSFEYDNDLTAPTIGLIFPEIFNATYNINMWINATLSESSSCSVNNSAFKAYTSNESFVSFNESELSDGFYSVDLTCQDTSQNNNTATENILFTVDRISPEITFIDPIQGETVLNDGQQEFSFNIQDNTTLFNYKFNVTVEGTGVVLYEEVANITGNNFTYEKTLNTSTWLNTTLKAIVRACDSHTNQKIKKATGIVKTKSKLKYQFGSTFITVESLDPDVKKSETKYLDDRYDFKFTYDEPSQYRRYKLTANQNIVYLPDSEYKGHFVINERWIDFEGYDNVIVEKVNDSYIITVDVNGSKNVHFKSIGELNCNTESITFILDPVPVGYSFSLIENTQWYNTELLDLDTTAGVLVFALILLIMISLIVFAELTQIPIIAILAAFGGMTFGVLVFVSLSAVLGVIISLISIMYIGRAIFMAR